MGSIEEEMAKARAKGGNGGGNGSFSGPGKFNTGLIGPGSGGNTGIPYTAGSALMANADTAVPDEYLGEDYSGPIPTWGDYDVWLRVNQPEEYNGLKKLMKAAKYSSWSSVLKGATFTNTPIMEFLTEQVDTASAAGIGGTGSGPYSTKTSNVSLSSDSSAAATLDQMYQQELGRTATDEEIAAFKKALNAQQMASPSTSVTKGVSAGRSSTSNSVTTTGFDPTRFARQYAQSQEGFGERYAGITFMDALDKAISSPDSLDQMAGNL